MVVPGGTLTPEADHRECQEKATDENKRSACKKALNMCERGCSPEPRRPFRWIDERYAQAGVAW